MIPTLALLLLLTQPAPDAGGVPTVPTDTLSEEAPEERAPVENDAAPGDAPSGDPDPTRDTSNGAPPATPSAPATGDTPATRDAPTAHTTAPVAPQVLSSLTKDIPVAVNVVLPNGQFGPVVTEVRLERRRQTPGTAPSVVWVALATTDHQGRATFSAPPLGMGESDRIVVRHDGHEVATTLTGDRGSEPVSLLVRPVSRDLTPLRMDIRVGLTPLDSVLRLDHVIRLENPTMAVLDTDQAEALRVPLFLPGPFGEPARGLFPGRPDPNELILQSQPDVGRLQVERGDLVYRGPIPPEGLMLRVIMAIPYDGASNHDLALLPPVDLHGLTVIAQAPPEVGLNLTLDRPTQLLTRPSQGGVEHALSLLQAPRAGEPIRLKVANTPDRHGLIRPLAAGISLAIIAAILVLVAAPQLRKRPPTQ